MFAVTFALAVGLLASGSASAETGEKFCGAGTAWDSASSSCVSSAPVPAPRQARSIGGTPSVTTSDGDLVFKVEKGKRVGYDVGGTTAYFKDLQLKKEDEAAARRDFAAIQLGQTIGRLAAESECTKKQEGNIKKVEDIISSGDAAITKKITAGSQTLDTKITAGTKAIDAKVAGLEKSVATICGKADQALETKLTKVIKETTSKDTAQALKCLNAGKFFDARCHDSKTNANACFVQGLHCLCKKAQTPDPKTGKLPVIKDFDVNSRYLCAALDIAAQVGIAKSDMVAYMSFDRKAGGLSWLKECGTAELAKTRTWKAYQSNVESSSKTAFSPDPDPGSAYFKNRGGSGKEHIKTTDAIGFKGDFTIEATVYASGYGTSNSAGLITGSCHSGSCQCGHLSGRSYCGWIWRLNGRQNQMLFQYYGKSEKHYTFPGRFPMNKWFHLVLTRNGDKLQAFADGKSLGTSGGWRNTWIRNSGSGTGIGASWLRMPTSGQDAYPHHMWQGYIDQVAIYNKAYTKPLFNKRIQCPA